MNCTATTAKIEELLSQLADANLQTRSQARKELVKLGDQVMPCMVEKLSSPSSRVRWEAAKAVGEIGKACCLETEVGLALVRLLKDDNRSVRWAATNSLTRLQRAALKEVLLALTQDFHSALLREGAHNVLHDLKKRGMLSRAEEQVFYALRGYAPAVEAAWAANRALIG
jgi:HEAT repeat protein